MSRLTVVCVLSGLATGTALGLGVFTFLYARGYSYATNDPAACANCHVMRDHFHAWTRSSHHAVAVCNDCHTPHDPIGKYLTKARNGLHHSLAFTTGDDARRCSGSFLHLGSRGHGLTVGDQNWHLIPRVHPADPHPAVAALPSGEGYAVHEA